jgi:hypothetical protein
MIKGKTPEEIHTTFNIKDDFTPEKRRKFEGKTDGLLSEFSLFRCQIVASVIGNLSLSQACHSWFLCFALCILQKASRKKVDNRFPDVFCH